MVCVINTASGRGLVSFDYKENEDRPSAGAGLKDGGRLNGTLCIKASSELGPRGVLRGASLSFGTGDSAPECQRGAVASPAFSN